MDWLTPTIAGGAALGSAAIGAAGTAVRNKKTLKYTKQLMDYQWQNYGSPQAQMAAYKAAGVNPFASQGLNPQQPQAQQFDYQPPALGGLQQFLSFIPQMAQLINQSYSADLIKGQTEGQTLANEMAAFDLKNMKPEQLRDLQTRIEKTLADTDLTKRQSELVTKQILTEVFKANNLEADTELKNLDLRWKGKQFEEGMPSVELDLLKHERDLKNFMAKEADYTQRESGRRDQEQQVIFDVFKNNRINYFKQIGNLQKMALEALSPEKLSKVMEEFNVPQGLRPFVQPIFYGLLFMMMDKISRMGSDMWNRNW